MNQEKIGKLIKEIRKKNHLTQQEFANLFGVTYQAVSKWENGKNIPDLAILKDICDTYHLDLNEVLDGKPKSKKKFIYIEILIFLIFCLILIFLFFKKSSSFEFKTISANCNNFHIVGSIAYNESKSSIYISHVDYCGTKDEQVYQKINCSLYEESENIKTKIEDCEAKEKITLEQYLHGVIFHVADYQRTCKNYQEDSLHLQIDAVDSNNNITTYDIPLKLEENCE